MTLSGPFTRANLLTERTTLAGFITTLVNNQNAQQAAIVSRDTLRVSLKERIRQFNQIVRAYFPNGVPIGQLGRVPVITSGQGIWFQALADTANVWDGINALLPVPPGVPIPLILTGGYTRALFGTDQTAMLAAFTTIINTGKIAETTIKNRDKQWNIIYQRLKQYRLAVQGRFPSGDPLIGSLPSITPTPGHTPDGVNVSAAWVPGILKARISFVASTDPDLQEYELRACFGSTYKVAEEVVLATLTAGSTPLNFESDQGLVASGSKVFYRVYVILKTSNEKGSKTVSVTRP
jgi:hypothetical protein